MMAVTAESPYLPQQVETKRESMLVPTAFCPTEWPNVHDLLEPAVERSNGRWTMGDLLLALCMGDQQLWITKEDGKIVAALTTQIVDYPSSRMLAVQFLGGKQFDEWSHSLLTLLEEFAKDSQCNGIEAVGRFGFWPFFRSRGYMKAYCTYQRNFFEDMNDE